MTFMDYRFLFLVKSFDLEDAGKILSVFSVILTWWDHATFTS